MILQRCYVFRHQPTDLKFYFNSGLGVVWELSILWHEHFSAPDQCNFAAKQNLHNNKSYFLG